MIGNISAHHSNTTLARTQGGALSRSGARVLLHTAAALSMASPRRAAPGRRSKQRAAVQASGAGPFPVPGLRPACHKGQRSGVRVREAGQTAQQVLNHPQQLQENDADRLSASRGAKGRKGKKRRAEQEPRPAGGRTGSTPAASRRQRRQAEAVKDVGVTYSRQRRSHSGVWENHVPSCQKQHAVPVYQDNFTAIADDLQACYRLAQDIHLQGHQTHSLPIGNRTHPFRGALDGAGYSLSVNLTRTQGDAVLFGTIEHSELRLSVVDSHLETRNGSRAALIGTMGSDNRVILSRLNDNLFRATGEGIVEAGLVAHTRRAGNRLELNEAAGNRVQAHALAPSGHCADVCLHRASVSLGLGTLWGADDRIDPHPHWQRVWQRGLNGNQLHARAGGTGPSDRTDVPAQAAAGMLGILGDRSGYNEFLWSWQERLDNNRIEAHALPGAGIRAGYSHASPGYACIGCDLQPPAAPTRDERLRALQVSFHNNSVQALSASMDREQGMTFYAVARSNLVSTGSVYFLQLHQRGLAPGQLDAVLGAGSDKRTSVAERALLPGLQQGNLFLFSQGDADLPLLVGNDTELQVFINASRQPYPDLLPGFIDPVTYLYRPFGAKQRKVEARINTLTLNSLEPRGWRQGHENLRSSLERFLLGPACDGQITAFHYPHEQLQSWVCFGTQALLLTRQRYPGHPAADQQGLMRISRYRMAAGGVARPKADIGLFQPRTADALAAQARPVDSLVQGSQLFQLYQQPDQTIALLRLPATGDNGHFELTRYTNLAGEARLLSVEDGELHLWTQENNNTLLAYGLGPEPLDNSSSWLHWGLDLSDQPGDRTLLARSGDWLYSLRQAEGQPASLRLWRGAKEALTLDRDWQPVWPGNLTQSLRLVVANGYLTAVPAGARVDCGLPGTGWQARVPDEGGCLQWTPIELMHYPLPHPLPAEAPAPSCVCMGSAATTSTAMPAPSASRLGSSDAGEEPTPAFDDEPQPTRMENPLGVGASAGWYAGLLLGGVACAFGWACSCKYLSSRRGLREAQSRRPPGEAPPHPRPEPEVARRGPFRETAV